MAHNKLWTMDPSHLTAAKLEYELRVRGVCQVGNGSERAKCTFFRRVLENEKNDETHRTHEAPSPLQLHNDLQLCEQSTQSIEAFVGSETGGADEFFAAWSRLLHLIARVKRMRPRLPVDHDRKVKLHLKLCELATKVYEVVQQFTMQSDGEHNNTGGPRLHRGAQATPAASARPDADVQPEQNEPEANSSGEHSRINLERFSDSFGRASESQTHSSRRSSETSSRLHQQAPRVHFRAEDSVIPDRSTQENARNEGLSLEIPSAFEIRSDSTESRLRGEAQRQSRLPIGVAPQLRAANNESYPQEQMSMMAHQGSLYEPPQNYWPHRVGSFQSPYVEAQPRYAMQDLRQGASRPRLVARQPGADLREMNERFGHLGNSERAFPPENRPVLENNARSAAFIQEQEWRNHRIGRESSRIERDRLNIPRDEPQYQMPYQPRVSEQRFAGARHMEPVHGPDIFAMPRTNPMGYGQNPGFGQPYGYAPSPSYYGSIPMRKSVPVNQWKISFSGEERTDSKTDLNIHDFLEQVEMFSRAESIPEDELLRQIVHLLQGRARAWYQNVYRQIVSWRHFVNAIKEKFLPLDYHFNLLLEIESRFQRKSEPVGAYINDMELRFRSLPEALPESHQIHIMRKNLLTDYTMQLANVDIRSVRELEDACKRIEGARMMLAARTGRDRFKDRADRSRSERYVSAIDQQACSDCEAQEDEEVELAEIRGKGRLKTRSKSLGRDQKMPAMPDEEKKNQLEARRMRES